MTGTEETTVHALLVASDSRDALCAAIAKAATIEHYTGAAVTAMLVFYDAIADEGTEWFNQADTERIIEHLKRTELTELEAALAPWREHIADLTVEVHFARDGATSICANAHAMKADLILKPMAPTARIVGLLHAPPDWQLMREAPCPVLFTRPDAWHKPVRILAAVDAADVAHATLNAEIVRRAHLLCRILDGELHLVSCYPALGQSTSQYQIASDFVAIKAEMKTRRTQNLRALLARLRVDAHEVHVIEGRPRHAIAATASRIDAGLTVLGTAARTGLGKLLIGNTAEGIASDLPTDLLTVREFG